MTTSGGSGVGGGGGGGGGGRTGLHNKQQVENIKEIKMIRCVNVNVLLKFALFIVLQDNNGKGANDAIFTVKRKKSHSKFYHFASCTSKISPSEASTPSC